MDPRCPGLYLFEVNADIGISSSEIYEPKNITDEVVIPPPELMPSKKARTAHGSYKRIIMHEKCGRPDSNGFQLK